VIHKVERIRRGKARETLKEQVLGKYISKSKPTFVCSHEVDF
jgi:hypothetical protein